MRITVTQYAADMTEQVAQFNARLQRAGVSPLFPACHMPVWLPKAPGRQVFQEYFVATDDVGAVRGAYGLKHQDFWINGRTVSIADLQTPVSEGVVNRAYTRVGVKLLLDALQRQPLLFGLGMGGYEMPIARLLHAAQWELCSVPFYFRVVHPLSFLHNIDYLRRSAPMRVMANLVALSGLGWLGIKGWQLLWHRIRRQENGIRIEIVDEFSSWADDLWQRCKPHYLMSAVRDCATLQILYPKDQQKFIRLKISQNGQAIGWAVLLNTALSGHKQFGNMQLGSIIDGFAAPADAGKVIRAAQRVLEEQHADLIVSNQAHAAWCRALADAGFSRGPSNFLFASAPQLSELLRAAGAKSDDLHLNRGDGDGPINL